MRILIQKPLSLGLRIIGLTLIIIASIVAINNLVVVNKYRSSATRQAPEGTNQSVAATQITQGAESLQRLVGQFKTEHG